MKVWIKRVALALAVVFVALQFVPVDRSNPPVTAPLAADAATMEVLRRCCYDCHSNEVSWPWYAYVAPASWLVAHDVEEGRAELNFSSWGEMSEGKRLSKASEMVEEIVEGHMPPSEYLILHGDARPSKADVAVLTRWAETLE